MLVASCATLILTAGLAFYDFQKERKEQKEQKEGKNLKDKNGSSIRILLTGGPYFIGDADAGARARG